MVINRGLSPSDQIKNDIGVYIILEKQSLMPSIVVYSISVSFVSFEGFLKFENKSKVSSRTLLYRD